MFLQDVVLICFTIFSGFAVYCLFAALLGIGTALVYPTFMAAIAENTHPLDRPGSLGVFRFWRDSGYAIGAIITGLVADAAGIESAILLVAGITVLSSFVLRLRYA